MEKPKVAIIGLKGIPAFGGSARAGENLITQLKNRYAFTVYNVASHTERKSGFYDGYELIVFKTFFLKQLNTFVYYIKALFHCLFFGKYNMVHVFHIDAAFIIPLLRIRYKVIAGHRARPQEFSKWNKFIKIYFNLMEVIFYKMPANIITAVSTTIVDQYQKSTKRKIIYIPNGINLHQKFIYEPSHAEEGYILFASGRIIETKGCHFMLEALENIQYRGLIIVAGNLEHTPAYKKQLMEFKNSLNIKFTGLIKDRNLLMMYFNKAKLAVYPSMHEGMSNTLLELASVRTPVISSDIPENKAVFDDTEVLFFKSADIVDLAAKLSWALNHRTEMEIRAELAYKKLAAKYNWENIASQYDDLYKKLIST
jgi:glycosyltransferase involved in cell wall biosynthesis